MLISGIAVLGLSALSQARAAEHPLVAVAALTHVLPSDGFVRLHLYDLQGHLIGSVPEKSGYDDDEPVFSADGTRLFYKRRVAPENLSDPCVELVMDVATGNIRRRNPSSDPIPGVEILRAVEDAAKKDRDKSWEELEARYYYSPDGRWGICAGRRPSLSPVERGPHGYFLLQQSGHPVPIENFPGFAPRFRTSGWESLLTDNESPFFLGPDFAAMFLRYHPGQGRGIETWGLDLRARKWTKLSENDGQIYRPPFAPGAFMITEEFDQPLGATGRTVDCSYLEWIDRHLHLTRFSPPLSSFYNAGIFHTPGDSPMEIEGLYY